MDYKKLKAFLKAEQKDVDAGKGASSSPRTAPHPTRELDTIIGTGSAFYIVPSSALKEIDYPNVIDDTRMADFFTKKEAIEPIAALTPTMHLYEVPQYKGPSYLYRKLAYEVMGEEGPQQKCVWVDRRFLDVIEPDAGTLLSCTNVDQPDHYGVYKIELVEKTMLRVKHSSSYFEVGKGQVHYWTTVMYCSSLNMHYSRLEGIGEDELPEPEGE